jgi:surfeit locus 1 family protein
VFLATFLFCGFVALGTWQLERRAWKLDLISRVEHRIHAPTVSAPERAQWPLVSRFADEYRHVTVTGTFLYESETLVQAATDLGPGFWVLTPLRQTDGTLVLINRGFVPPELRDSAARSAVAARAVRPGHSTGELMVATTGAGTLTVAGLLRISEPGGGFLRHNEPAANRWYSRDMQAIAAARGLGDVAPYFIDADTQPQQESEAVGASGAASGDVAYAPVAGLTVVTFRNNHLEYAVTWYTLALMVIGAVWVVMREDRRRRQI